MATGHKGQASRRSVADVTDEADVTVNCFLGTDLPKDDWNSVFNFQK